MLNLFSLLNNCFDTANIRGITILLNAQQNSPQGTFCNSTFLMTSISTISNFSIQAQNTMVATDNLIKCLI